MSVGSVVEFLCYFESFRNVDLFEQGYVLSYRNDGLWNGEKRIREFFFGKDLQIRAVHNNEEIQIETFRTQKDEITVDVFSFIQWWLLAARLVGGGGNGNHQNSYGICG